MLVFLVILLVLCAVTLSVWKQANISRLVIKSDNFENLQNRYLNVYYLATLADWLQGPYLYRLYSEYGYNNNEIGILYVVGIVSSSVLGIAVGYLADRYGRKLACALYGIVYALCCLAYTSPRYHVLLIGRIFGGLSTSILFTAFEAWYVNEHINRYNLPPDWLNDTFGKSGACSGPLAITAGLLSQFIVEWLGCGPVAPFLLAVPVLMLSTFFVLSTWDEQYSTEFHQNEYTIRFSLSSLKLIFKDRLLLLLCLIQSLYESVTYAIIFLWTPILTPLHPPLGLIFSVLMLAFTLGSNSYVLLISKNQRPSTILTAASALALLSTFIVTLSTFLEYYFKNHDLIFKGDKFLLYSCFLGFVLYEISVGLYNPAVGFVRGMVVPEKSRTSVANWFRFPMNMFTCFVLLFKPNGETIDHAEYQDYKFSIIFFGCTMMMLIATGASGVFRNFFLKSSDAVNDPTQDISIVSGENFIKDYSDNDSVSNE